MSKKKVLLRGVFINRDTNGEGVLKVGTTLIRVSTVMGILYLGIILLAKSFTKGIIKLMKVFLEDGLKVELKECEEIVMIGRR